MQLCSVSNKNIYFLVVQQLFTVFVFKGYDLHTGGVRHSTTDRKNDVTHETRVNNRTRE
jgi:hypothetical protein